MAIRSSGAVAGILLASTLAGYPACAADVANSSTLEEIVVTAQKRAGSVQDTPFSVSATTEEQIRNSGAGNITDFARNITAQPRLGVVEGVVDGSVEVPKSGSVGGSGRLAVNLPVGETAAVRFVMY